MARFGGSFGGFSGPPRSGPRTVVSLGGVSAEDDRAALLAKAKNERENRRLAKEREKSVRVVQRRWRGYRGRKKAMEAWMQDYRAGRGAAAGLAALHGAADPATDDVAFVLKTTETADVLRSTADGAVAALRIARFVRINAAALGTPSLSVAAAQHLRTACAAVPPATLERALAYLAKRDELFPPLADALKSTENAQPIRDAAAAVAASALRHHHAAAVALLFDAPRFVVDALIPALRDASTSSISQLAHAACAAAAERTASPPRFSSSALTFLDNVVATARATAHVPCDDATTVAVMHALADAAAAVPRGGGAQALVDPSVLGWCARQTSAATDDAVIFAMARVVLATLSVSGPSRAMALTKLAFHADTSGRSLLGRLWRAYSACDAAGAWPVRAQRTSPPDGSMPMETDTPATSSWQEGGASCLLVFARLYAYRLATCDVEEFFVAGNPDVKDEALHAAARGLLAPDEAGGAVRACRTSLERLLWTESEQWVGDGASGDDSDSDDDDDDDDDGGGGGDWCADDPFARALASGTAPDAASVRALHRQLVLWLGRLLGMLRRINDRRAFVDRNEFYAPPNVINLSDSRAALELATASAAEVAGTSGGGGGTSSSTISPSTTARREPLAWKVRRLLRHGPFLLPFLDRVRIFRGLVSRDREEARRRDATAQFNGGRNRFGVGSMNAFDPSFDDEPMLAGGGFNAPRHIHVQRGHLLEDGFRELSNMTSTGWKRQMRIAFHNEHGIAEAGIDGGGLFKDFMGDIAREAFAPGRGLFCETDSHELYPNPASAADAGPDHLAYFAFLGRVVGKAMYEDVLVDLPFAKFFLTKLVGRRANDLDDLPSLDGALYRSLKFVQRYTGDVRDLSLTFTASRAGVEGDDVDLLPNGANVAVTNENRLRYIHLVAHLRLNVALAQQSSAFLRGMSDVVDPLWLRMFDERELQVLIAGADGDSGSVDVADWQRNTVYGGGYHEDHEVIKAFWQVVSGFSADERKAVLKFATACSRAPVLGFGSLEPKFCIHRTASSPGDHLGNGVERLPSASTCMNLLKLPPYRDQETLKQKVLYAAMSGAGFDLS